MTERKKTLKAIAIHTCVSIAIGLFGFFIFSLFYNSFIRYLVQKQNAKAIFAKTLISCLRSSDEDKCYLFFKRLNHEVPESAFAIWVIDEKKKLLFTNTDTNVPIVPKTDFHATSQLTFLESKKYSFVPLSVPTGYIDDPALKRRFIIGDPLPGSNISNYIFQILAFGALIFILGSTLSALMTFQNLRNRSRESRRILLEFKSGHYGRRFSISALDSFTELSSSFNEILTTLEKALLSTAESDSQRRQLISELSHDLRTPLTTIKSVSEVLISKNTDVVVREECTQILMSELHYIDQLLHDLFELSLVESSHTTQTFVKVPVDALFYDVKHKYSQQEKVSISFVNHNYQSFSVIGDKLLLIRAFNNLIENSLRFTKSSLKIEFIHVKTQNLIRIDIIDDGPGFKKSEMESFGTKSAKRVITGNHIHAGLGSIIAKKIIHAHGGNLHLENLHPGAKISILLPLYLT